MASISFLAGEIPADSRTLRALTVGLDSISSFWKKWYFEDYIASGGSCVKFVTGRRGSGKSHLAALAQADASESGFYAVRLSADDILMSDFSSVYRAVYQACSLTDFVKKASNRILSSLGYDWNGENGKSFLEYMSDSDQLDPMVRREIRTAIKGAFAGNPYIDVNFSSICSLLAGNYLGILELDETALDTVFKWLNGDKDISVSSMRSLGLSSYKITKTNARYMLRSLSELVRLAGFRGIFISIDDLDVLANSSALDKNHYTKQRRDDAYESIRQLIDDIDTFRYTFILLSFDRILIDDERRGIKSYQALWLRMENEIVSKRLNYFSSMFNLDSANTVFFTAENVVEFSRRICDITNGANIASHPIRMEDAEKLIDKSRFASDPLPLLVRNETLSVSKEVSNV